MKLLATIFIVFAVCGTAFCDSKEQSSEEIDVAEDVANAMKELIVAFHEGGDEKDKAVENVTKSFDRYCPGGSEKIKEKTQLFFNCISELDEDTTYCHDVEIGIPKCFKPLVELFEACLPAQTKTLPDHIVKTAKSIFKYLCRSDGEHIFELLNFCVFDETEKYKKCEHKIRAKIEKYANTVPNKDELCSIFTSMRPCFAGHVEEACKNPITREAHIGFYDALIQPCTGVNAVDVDNN